MMVMMTRMKVGIWWFDGEDNNDCGDDDKSDDGCDIHDDSIGDTRRDGENNDVTDGNIDDTDGDDEVDGSRW